MNPRTLTPDQFDALWDGLEDIRGHVSATADLSDALALVGLAAPAASLRKTEDAIADLTIRMQAVLGDAGGRSEPSPSGVEMRRA